MKQIDLPTSIGKVARRELMVHGFVTLNQVAKLSEQELLAIHGVGPKAVRLLKAAFEEHNLKSPML